MDFQNIKELTIPDGDVTKITIGESVMWEKVVAPSYKNWVKYAIDTDGSLYNECGYMDNYRLSSSGAVKEQNTDHRSTVTGFIPAKSNDLVRIGGYPWYSTTSAMNYICVYDADFNFIYAGTSNSNYDSRNIYSSVVQNGDTTEIQLKEISNMAYIRLSYYGYGDGYYDGKEKNTTGENLIVTINEEIPI